MMTCTAAQSASERFRKHTWALVMAVLTAHLVCFAVLVTQVNSRYQ